MVKVSFLACARKHFSSSFIHWEYESKENVKIVLQKFSLTTTPRECLLSLLAGLLGSTFDWFFCSCFNISPCCGQFSESKTKIKLREMFVWVEFVEDVMLNSSKQSCFESF